MDAWERMLAGEWLDTIPHIQDDLENGEFGMNDNWFVQHPEVMRYILEHEHKAEQAQAAIATECDIVDEQQELQEAWDALQDVPSYIEQQAAAFAKEV